MATTTRMILPLASRRAFPCYSTGPSHTGYLSGWLSLRPPWRPRPRAGDTPWGRGRPRRRCGRARGDPGHQPGGSDSPDCGPARARERSCAGSSPPRPAVRWPGTGPRQNLAPARSFDAPGHPRQNLAREHATAGRVGKIANPVGPSRDVAARIAKVSPRHGSDTTRGLLGVDRDSVKGWDRERGGNPPGRTDSPTHYRSADERIKPLHPDRATSGRKAPDRPPVRAPRHSDFDKEVARPGRRAQETAATSSHPPRYAWACPASSPGLEMACGQASGASASPGGSTIRPA